MQEKYYQVILNNGKTHKSIYKTIPNAIKNVGVSNIKKIVELRKELVETKYLEQVGTQNIE
jgi:hypothetical protein